MSKLKELSGSPKLSTSIAFSQSTTMQEKAIPKDALILSKDVRVNTEKIENGFLIVKTWDIRWKMKPDDSSEYSYITKKYYSKDDPLTINTKDKALADMFEEIGE